MNSKWTGRRLDRRALLRGGLLGGAGLAAAALVGCGDSGDSEEDELAALRAARDASRSANHGAVAAPATDSHGAAATDSHGAAVADEHGAGPPHWTYAGEGGPTDWGALSPEYSACSAGSNQSPINLSAGPTVNSTALSFNYQPSSLTVINNGHTIQANVPPGNSIAVDGKTFGLLQFHFHAPSEHTIDESYYPLEMHLVHANTEGNLAVVGVLFADGPADAALAPVWAQLPHTTADQGVAENFNLAAVLPASHQLYRYSGSLTTPPCSEGVRWMVMQTPRRVSAEQVHAFSALVGPNNRPVQSTGAREVLQERAFNIAGNR